MAFIETPRFPDAISYGSSGGPEYLTEVVVTDSGQEYRNQNWQASRGKWDVSHGVKTHAQMAEVRTFFRIAKGRKNAFRFKDWFDFQATDAPALSITGATFQLWKRYTWGAETEDRKIQKPVSGTVTVKKNGVALTEGVDFTLNYTNGIITMLSSYLITDTFTWTGEFDVPVRFDTDVMQAAYDTFGTESWSSIPLIEVRL